MASKDAVRSVSWTWTGGGSGNPYSGGGYMIHFDSCGMQTVTASITDCDTSKSTQIDVCCEDECCDGDECKDCCKNSTTGNCEGHNSECGCDPIGLETCTDKIKEWTIGQARLCWSECGGEPCYKDVVDVPCYAWQFCNEGYFHEDSTCLDPSHDCAYTIIGICQECWAIGDAYIEPQMDCQCE